ncbi:hypothetical protein CC78DRAFT_611743 [Lojkania enalia]|uniref:Uncharacterized protein n=1 Tax=Lojkania enalia TaxID=147567 RepID=A0A9P4NBG3_9PLEO|nr:hypothetical protein CC78DRAFT_611743 [Didymosphaeria enalia]
MANMRQDAQTALLCKQPWRYDPEGQCEIAFEQNGGGYLICRSEFAVFVCAALEWTWLGPEADNNSTPANSAFQFGLEIGLHREVPPNFKTHPRKNEVHLNDIAFQARRFVVTLEEGVFWHPAVLEPEVAPAWIPKCTSRITFDRSPCPPPEHWRSTKGGPRANQFWDMKEFCSGEIPRRRG